MAEQLYTFPSGKIEALALLYVQNQDVSAKTPEELADIYQDAYTRIHAEFMRLIREKKQKQDPYNPVMF